MTDDHELEGLDPYRLLDVEAARIDAYLSSLPDDDPAWNEPTRCADWDRRQLLAHLAATEEYHHACLDDALDALLAKGMEAGVTDVAGFNALGVEQRADAPPSAILSEWRTQDAETRRRLRERGDGDMATMVGPYPSRWQSFHVALELATHADDLGVPVSADEQAERGAWRARVSRFTLVEAKTDLQVRAVAGGTTQVTGQGIDVTVDDDTLVEAVASRLEAGPGLDEQAVAVLNTTP